jgi:uncharacterized protein YjiK
VKLEPVRVEDVPVPELSGLAVTGTAGGELELLAIGDRKSVLARATLTDGPLRWNVIDLERTGLGADRPQFEAISATADGTILLLCEDPPVVVALRPEDSAVDRIALVPGDRGLLADVFDKSSSSGEGLLPLSDGRFLVAKEKDPPLLVEFGARGADAFGVQPNSLLTTGDRLAPTAGELHALAAWKIDGVDDISDLAFPGGVLYCLSDQSRRVVTIELPLESSSDRARVGEKWDLKVPERDGEPDGKPEGLVVVGDTLIIGLDTETPRANLCWYEM